MTQANDSKSISNSIKVSDGVEVFFDRTTPDKHPSEIRNFPLFLVNGHTRSSSDFKVMSRKLAKEDIETIAIDNRNSGRTQCNHDYSFERFSEDILAVMDELKLSSADFLGISMGGAIVQNLAAKYPHRVRKAIIVSSFVENKASKRSIPWGESLESVKLKLSKYFASEYSRRNHLLLEAMSKQILDKIKNGSFSENASRQRSALKDLDLSQEIINIKAKCLIVHGSEDEIIHIDQSRRMSKLIPRSNLKEYDGVGHLILAEKPDLFLNDVISFLNDLN